MSIVEIQFFVVLLSPLSCGSFEVEGILRA